MRLNTAERQEAATLRAEGWTVHRNGWPDFLAEKDGQFRIIEVKKYPDRLSTAQKAMCRAIFRWTGVKLEIRQYGRAARRLTDQERIDKKRAEVRAWAAKMRL
jgi:hypothetical protein